jgi:hypothetical protein
MMEAVRTSETSVDNHFTRQYNPEDSSEHHRFDLPVNRLCWEMTRRSVAGTNLRRRSSSFCRQQRAHIASVASIFKVR